MPSKSYKRPMLRSRGYHCVWNNDK